eukprot:3789098-Pleurochrysis_carterae.AAC.1
MRRHKRSRVSVQTRECARACVCARVSVRASKRPSASLRSYSACIARRSASHAAEHRFQCCAAQSCLSLGSSYSSSPSSAAKDVHRATRCAASSSARALPSSASSCPASDGSRHSSDNCERDNSSRLGRKRKRL